MAPIPRITLHRFVWTYFQANLQGALEYRIGFISQMLAMLINDAMWLLFWTAYFSKFPLVAGWGRTDIIMLWAVVAAGFGLATTLCGNLFRVAGMIVRGELDAYLTLPKPVLPHVLISRMSLTAPGDVLFGFLGFGFLVHPHPMQWTLFTLFTVTTALIFVGFALLTQSLSFWLGNAEGFSGQLINAMISFSTYPTAIFRGTVKVLLFTVLPAGFVSYVPVQLLRDFSWPLFAGLMAFAGGILAAGWLVFTLGLRRYESGSLLQMRG
jgi:ABC-2 type transport system permease protein